MQRKTIGPSTVIPPNTVDSTNEGVSEALPPTEFVEGVNIPQGSEFETESSQASLGAQPPLPNVFPNFDDNISIIGGYSEGKGATSNDDGGPSDKSLLRNFRIHRARSIVIGQEKLLIRIYHHQSTWDLKKKPQVVQDLLEKVLSDGTVTAAKKKKRLTMRFVARAYMLYVLGCFLFPTKKGTNVSTRYLVLFAKDKGGKKRSWGSTVLAHMYYNLGAASRDDGRQFACCTTLLEIFAHFPKLVGIPKEMDSDAYEHCTCWKWDVSVTDRYGGIALLNFREALDSYKLEDLLLCLPINMDKNAPVQGDQAAVGARRIQEALLGLQRRFGIEEDIDAEMPDLLKVEPGEPLYNMPFTYWWGIVQIMGPFPCHRLSLLIGFAEDIVDQEDEDAAAVVEEKQPANK
ncbi:hypothetical protein GIB67_001879 [Kingdonia uniflora]|uniref:Aminotransferase-like plant mobile domain-containing protein n=1 Tax=Kingdonia uniflora TaxID=39325 RepID=A0A7J7LQP4_9MAGN|nr:hypothetical protein GIB67_001879 [Kingdonia uniflora]